MSRANRRLLAAAILYPPVAVGLLLSAAVITGGLAGPEHFVLIEYVAPAVAAAGAVWAGRPRGVASWVGLAGFAGWTLAVGQLWRAFVTSMWDSC